MGCGDCQTMSSGGGDGKGVVRGNLKVSSLNDKKDGICHIQKSGKTDKEADSIIGQN